MRIILDQVGTPVEIPSFPKRIVSLVPSQTELLADLGLDDNVAGITKFCIYPESWRKTKTITGGTKNFRFDVMDSLNPDLIIGNKEENYPEGIKQLREKYPVWMSNIVTRADALNMIEQIGLITGTQSKAQSIVSEISASLTDTIKLPPLRTLYLIWRTPWMAAAQGTFIHEMLGTAGLVNCIRELQRYPELSDQQIQQLNPELILLSSEPYPFKSRHVDEIQGLCPQAKIILVNGEMFSWYGSRMRFFSAYVQSIRSVYFDAY